VKIITIVRKTAPREISNKGTKTLRDSAKPLAFGMAGPDGGGTRTGITMCLENYGWLEHV
jgi:hypothetical protein